MLKSWFDFTMFGTDWEMFNAGVRANGIKHLNFFFITDINKASFSIDKVKVAQASDYADRI